ncbi:Uncharacterised protein [Bartonella doshiae]|uniref:Uncharacterized protein n=1 Tax=Bartonella doshiae TaxID=33044 RepID=A0A380ZH46_BARDO|nr:Uncharacterised protein [Bartonella doshiae]
MSLILTNKVELSFYFIYVIKNYLITPSIDE